MMARREGTAWAWSCKRLQGLGVFGLYDGTYVRAVEARHHEHLLLIFVGVKGAKVWWYVSYLQESRVGGAGSHSYSV